MGVAAPERVVKPRKRTTNTNRPIIAVDLNNSQYLTEDGEISLLDDLGVFLRTTVPSIVVSNSSAELLGLLDEKCSFDPAWQFGVTPLEREMFTPSIKKGHSIKLKGLAVNFFGWQLRTKGSHTANLYHLALDPFTFSSFPLAQHDLEAFMEWGRELRAFCLEQEINLRPTQGATARQFLRDDRFYPEARRKVPRATNEKIRSQLVGNHYEVRAETNEEYTGIYIDQTKAHHYHAAEVTFPDANSLFAYGCFHGSQDRATEWRTDPERIGSFLEGFTGLIYGKLQWEPRPLRWIPDYLQDTTKPVYWYTTDQPLLDSLGVTVTTLICAWGSKRPETGINRYAEWCQEELGAHPPMWKKTLLLSAYGGLATRSRPFKVGFAKSNRGEVTEIPAGRHHTVTARVYTTSRALEPSTNNVLHRGLIEAATRVESLMFANYLQEHGHHVLCIYADAVMVEKSSKELPLIPDPWRTKRVLHHLRFISTNAFCSDEMTKIPGGQTAEQSKAFRPALHGDLAHVRLVRDRYPVKRHVRA